MYYGAPSALLGFGFFQHNSSFAWTSAAMSNNPAMSAATFFTIGGQFQDVNRINYFTPRFYGLQIGVGYAPKINLAVNGLRARGLTASVRAPARGICGYNDATTANSCPTNDNSWQDVFDVGANYLNKFGDVTVALFGALDVRQLRAVATTTSLPATPTWSPAPTSPRGSSGSSAPQFGFAGFTVGGSIGWDNNGFGNNYYTGGRQRQPQVRCRRSCTKPARGRCRSAGAMSTPTTATARATLGTITPGHHERSRLQAALAGHLGGLLRHQPARRRGRVRRYTADKYEIGVNYALGPGIKLVGGGISGTWAARSTARQGQSWAAMLGMDLRF